MILYMNNITKEMCLLSAVNPQTGTFQMEYDNDRWEFTSVREGIDVNVVINDYYTEIGHL